ncbi:cytochrome P450 [Salix suchowensis]|nr:cytochrome P450 [Salix suchowensis]
MAIPIPTLAGHVVNERYTQASRHVKLGQAPHSGDEEPSSIDKRPQRRYRTDRTLLSATKMLTHIVKTLLLSCLVEVSCFVLHRGFFARCSMVSAKKEDVSGTAWASLHWEQPSGPVVSLFLGSTPVVVLGTPQAAWDLLDKRSDIYSSRPRGEILSDNKRGLMLPYGEEWRKWRKILHSGFHARKSDEYQPIQSLESKIMMHQILTEPKGYERHIQRYAASVVTSVTYGKRIDSVDEWIVRENMRAMDCALHRVPSHIITVLIPSIRSLDLTRYVSPQYTHAHF